VFDLLNLGNSRNFGSTILSKCGYRRLKIFKKKPLQQFAKNKTHEKFIYSEIGSNNFSIGRQI
jgi:hypothetical protein